MRFQATPGYDLELTMLARTHPRLARHIRLSLGSYMMLGFMFPDLGLLCF